MLKIRLHNIFLVLVGLLLIWMLYSMYLNTKHLKEELNSSNERIELLLDNIEHLKDENSLILEECSKYQETISNLETEIKTSKKAKIKLVEKVKYINVTNDTIQNLVALNEENDRIIDGLDSLLEIKNKIILNQNVVIDNYDLMQKHFEAILADREQKIIEYNKALASETRKKIFWRTTTIGAIGAVTIILLL